ncbi:type II secretion system protein N [Hyphococcus sp.]|uniref:type II secretion system protein N n=1 Tax=Hyphococcus sp. TaxID=2038636 RepID=UPI003750D929
MSKLVRAPRLAELLLVAFIAYLLALATWAFFAPLPVPKGDRLAALPAAQSNQTQLNARNPFPKAAIDAAPIEAGPELAETALDLTLTGVWPGAEGGSAIIRRPDGKERRFETGEEIVSGVKLIAVYGDQVVIEQNGVRESLRFETKAQVERRVVAPKESAPAVTPPKISNNGLADMEAGDAFRLAPARNSAGNLSLAVYAGSNRALFERTGLRDGDIIVSINGSAAPASPGEILALIGGSAQPGKINLVVERDGEKQTIALSGGGVGKE